MSRDTDRALLGYRITRVSVGVNGRTYYKHGVGDGLWMSSLATIADVLACLREQGLVAKGTRGTRWRLEGQAGVGFDVFEGQVLRFCLACTVR